MDFFKFFSSKPSSKNVAKERLNLILIHDRADFAPELLGKIKEEILSVISKYVEIDDDEVDVKLTPVDERERNSSALVASIPIKRLKGDR